MLLLLCRWATLIGVWAWRCVRVCHTVNVTTPMALKIQFLHISCLTVLWLAIIVHLLLVICQQYFLLQRNLQIVIEENVVCHLDSGVIAVIFVWIFFDNLHQVKLCFSYDLKINIIFGHPPVHLKILLAGSLIYPFFYKFLKLYMSFHFLKFSGLWKKIFRLRSYLSDYYK